MEQRDGTARTGPQGRKDCKIAHGLTKSTKSSNKAAIEAEIGCVCRISASTNYGRAGRSFSAIRRKITAR
jgi:hypothetical protein